MPGRVGVIVGGLIGVLMGACSREAAPAAHAQQPPRQQQRETLSVAYDHALTDTARIMAGMAPEDTTRFARVLGRPNWTTYHTEFDRNWSQVSTQRFPLMRDWREREFKKIADACDVLFYPFGGPDFLNAYLLYPGCNSYLLFGLEPVGSVPAIEKRPAERIDRALTEVRASLSDMFVRDYFITKTMMDELRTPEVDGTLPLMLAFLARLDGRVVSIEFDGPWNPNVTAGPAAMPAATRTAGPTGTGSKPSARPGRVPGVTVRFVQGTSSRVQALTYIRVNMQDPDFGKKTGLISYLTGLGQVTTFIKSASYLMHDDRFSRVRDMVLAQSRSLLQDDTGVPFRFLDKATWDITLYGRYTPPIRDFNYGFQRNLDEAFKQPSAARDLPFSFGYHWREGTSSVILAVRRAGSH